MDHYRLRGAGQRLWAETLSTDMTPQPGQFYRCEITETHDYDLVAKIL